MIDTYGTLKSAVANWLDRSDLSARIPEYIQLAEAEFRRDQRVKKLIYATQTITGDAHALPAAILSLEAWWHDGGDYYGPIVTVGADQLGTLKASHGPTGPPRYVALVDGLAYFAPVPSETYTTKMTYWQKVPALVADTDTNWLLDDHPDAYLYGALMAAAPYLKDDERVALWSGMLEKALDGIHQATWSAQFSGTMRRRFKPIGG